MDSNKKESQLSNYLKMLIKSKDTKTQQFYRNKIIEIFYIDIKKLVNSLKIKLPPHIETQDLFNQGVFGLIDALSKIDKDRLDTFNSYAKYRIKGEILDFLRTQDVMPRSQRDKMKAINAAQEHLLEKLKRTPTDQEVADHLQISLDELNKDKRTSQNVVLIRHVQGDQNSEESTDIFDLVTGTNEYRALEKQEEQLFHDGLKDKLYAFMNYLTAKEQLVFDLQHTEELHMQEIAKIYKMSSSRISQINTKTVKEILLFLQHQQNMAKEEDCYYSKNNNKKTRERTDENKGLKEVGVPNGLKKFFKDKIEE